MQLFYEKFLIHRKKITISLICINKNRQHSLLKKISPVKYRTHLRVCVLFYRENRLM